jgi:hypothetical protein
VNVEMKDLDLVLMLRVNDDDAVKKKMMKMVVGVVMDKNMFAVVVVHWDKEILVAVV